MEKTWYMTSYFILYGQLCNFENQNGWTLRSEQGRVKDSDSDLSCSLKKSMDSLTPNAFVLSLKIFSKHVF